MNKSKKESKGTAPVSGAPPLALTAPSSKRAKRPRKAKARKPQPEQSSDHKRVVEHYFATFEAHRGEKPSFDGADGKAVQRLLDTLNGDAARACKAITDGFASWKGDTLSIRQIARDPSTFIGAKPRFNAANRVQNSGTDPFGESI